MIVNKSKWELWAPAILVAASGACAGVFVAAVLKGSNFYTAIALETGAIAFLLFWWIYSKVVSRLLGRDLKAILWADSISYLPAIILLSYLYLSQFPTLFSQHHLLRTLPRLVIGMIVAIKAISYVGLRFSSIKFVSLVLISFIAAVFRAGFIRGPLLGKLLSLEFVLWWQFFLVVGLFMWNAIAAGSVRHWLRATAWTLAALIATRLATGFLMPVKPPAPSLDTIVSRLPECPPFPLLKENNKLRYRRLRIADQVRDALILPPLGAAEAELTVPPQAQLRVGMGILPAVWDQEGDGVNFIVEIKAGESSKKMMSLYLDPKGYPEHRGWVDRFIDLSPYEGQTVSVTFRTEGGPQIRTPFNRQPDTRFDYSVFSEPRLVVPNPGHPNVVLILLDTLRSDHVGAYGYQRDTTPNLDALANEGVLFEQTVSQSSWTMPSVATVFTSLYPSEHGLTSINRPFLDDRFDTIAEDFSRAGYETAAVSATPIISDQGGFGQGFRTFDETCYQMLDIAGAECVTDAAIEWINKASGPFFIYLHYYDPHSPYNAPPPFRTMFDPAYVPAGLPLKNGEGHYFDQIIRYMGHSGLTDRELKYMIALYDGDIRYADDNVGRLLKRLRASGDNTVIAVIADHGEEFMEHGHLMHGHTLYSEALNVPFILKTPGSSHAGQRIKQIVRLIDVAPTLLEAAGLAVSAQMHGQSVLPLLNGEGLPRVVFSEVYDFRDIYALRDGSVAYIMGARKEHPQGSALFDLSCDPGEMHDIAEREQALTGKMSMALGEFLKALQRPKLPPRSIDELTRKRLEALGYLDPKTGKLKK